MNDNSDDDLRATGPIIDLQRLEEQAEALFLHRFVESVRKARGEHGRFLALRPGDELAIAAAGDGSLDVLDDVVVDIELE